MKEWVCAEMESNKQYISTFCYVCMLPASCAFLRPHNACLFWLPGGEISCTADNATRPQMPTFSITIQITIFLWKIISFSMLNVVVEIPLQRMKETLFVVEVLKEQVFLQCVNYISDWNGDLFLIMKFQIFLGKETMAEMFLIGFMLKQSMVHKHIGEVELFFLAQHVTLYLNVRCRPGLLAQWTQINNSATGERLVQNSCQKEWGLSSEVQMLQRALLSPTVNFVLNNKIKNLISLLCAL